MPLKLILTPSNPLESVRFSSRTGRISKGSHTSGQNDCPKFFIPQNKIDVNNYFLKEQVKLIIYLFFEVYDNVYYHFKFKKTIAL